MQTVKILIGSDFDPRGFTSANRSFRELDGAAKDFIDTLKMGVGIDLGGRIVQSLAEIPAILQQAIANGVKFNAELQTAQLGIAAVIKQFDTTGTKSFDAALRESAEAVELLKKKALESPATFQQLVSGFQAVTGAATGAGIKLNDQVNLIVLMSQALAGLGIRSEQIIQESRALITGNINEDAAAARILNITKEQIELAREQGNLYEFLTQRLSAFSEAGQRGSVTLTTALSNMEDAITQLEAQVAKPVFEALTEGIIALNAELSKPEVVDGLRSIGYEVAEIVKGGMAMIKWAVENAETLATMAQVAGLLGVALAALKIAQLTAQLGAWAISLATGTAALEAETAALARNTVAQATNAAARTANNAASGARNLAPMANGMEPMLSRAEWVKQTRTLRPGGTTFARYTANGINGVNLGRAGTAASMAARAGAGAAGAGAGMAIAGAIAYGGLIIAITTLVVALNQLRLAYKEAETTRVRDDLDNSGKIREKLMEFAQEGRAGSGDELKRRVDAERARLETLAQNETDPAQQIKLRENIGRLNEVLMNGESARKKRAEEDAEFAAVTEREKKLAEETEEHQRKDGYAREMGARSEKIGETLLDSAAQTDNPADRMAALQAKAMYARLEHGNAVNPSLTGVDPLTASPEALIQASYNSIGKVTSQEALDAANKLLEITRQIKEINEENGRATEENMAREAQRFLKQKETKEAMESEKEILTAQASGQVAVAVAAQRRRDIEEEIKSLMAQQVDSATARKHAEEMAELKQQTTRREALRDLEAQHEIMTARIAGNTALVEKLERQRDIQREINQLESQGLSTIEARAQAEQAANDRDALRDRDRKRRLEEIRAEDKTASEESKGHKTGARRAADKEWELKRRHELEDQGFDPETVNRTIEDEGATRRRERGGIGGPTKRSEADKNFGGGLTPEDEWNSKFKGKGGSGPNSTALDEGPTNRSDKERGFGHGLTSETDWRSKFPGQGSEAAPGGNTALDQGRPKGGFGGGLTAESDWRKKFPGTLGEVTPEPTNRPNPTPSTAQGDTGGNGGEDGNGNSSTDSGEDSATAAVQQAGEAGQEAGKSLQGAAKNLEKGMKSVEKGATSDLGAVNAAIDSLGSTLTSKLTELQTRITDLENRVASI